MPLLLLHPSRLRTLKYQLTSTVLAEYNGTCKEGGGLLMCRSGGMADALRSERSVRKGV